MSRVPVEVTSAPFQLPAIIRLTLCMRVLPSGRKVVWCVCVSVKEFFSPKQTNMNDYVFYPDNQQPILH